MIVERVELVLAKLPEGTHVVIAKDRGSAEQLAHTMRNRGMAAASLSLLVTFTDLGENVIPRYDPPSHPGFGMSRHADETIWADLKDLVRRLLRH